MPSRQQFGQLFKFAASHRDVDIRHKLKVLSDYLKIQQKRTRIYSYFMPLATLSYIKTLVLMMPTLTEISS